MADLVLGLAKSAVEGTLTMAKSVIEDQRKLKSSVQRDLMLISDEFEMMHSFLNITKERAIDDMVSTLVRQVRDMAFEVEDCIESVVDLENNSSLWRRLLPSFMPAAAPVVALDEAVDRIELLKARVEAMEQRNMRYSHIGESSSKIVVPTPSVVGNPIAFDILEEVRDSAMHQSNNTVDLIKLINRTSGVLHVISVWGKGGEVGTVSIIQNAYDKPEICKNFLCRAWVKLVQPFNPEGFLRSILTQFYTNYCPEQSTSDILTLMKPIKVMAATKLELVKEFLKQVNTQRYLIVLEDISDMVDLETIRAFLPDNNNGSCIVVQTRQLEIARLCIGHSHEVSELKRFSKDHSVYVFFKKDDNGNNEQTTKQKAAHVWLESFRHLRIGREIDLNMFRGMVVPSDHRQVLFVWGVAGVGKTSIVKHVYCSEVLLQHRNFQKFGWVNVSHPFSVKDLSWNLLLDLHSESPQDYNMSRIRDPIQECRDLVHEHNCLVVIDGIESVEEWHLTKDTLEIGHSQSRIIVITNEENVATHCAMQSNSTFNVKVLEVDEVLQLFEKRVHENTGTPFIPTRVTDLTILHKCGGLPKVIVAVADFLRSFGSENWRMLSDRFMYELETNQAFGSLQGLFKWVHSYFRTCPDFLKPCIFYLSIFPVNHVIRRRRLIRRWIAEGYSRDTKESTAEEKTEEYFSKLVKLSMIQLLGSTAAMSFNMRMPLCQVNGFFREYIISRSMDENLVFSLEGRCHMNSQHTGQHLAIGSTWDRDRNVLESIDVSRLRSLTVFGEWRSFFISDKMKLLRVLDLEDTSGVTNKDLKQMLKFLPRLKFLSLRRCRYISHLPNSLGHLRQLQSLDIRDTSIIRLPKSIIKLHKLQYIRAGTTERMDYDNSIVESQLAAAGTPSLCTCLIGRLALCTCHRIASSLNAGVELSAGIGHLMALHTLGVIDISVKRGRAILADLKNLTQLHKLGVSGINKNNSQEFISAISGHGHLESLSLQLDEDNQGYLDSISLRLENLWSLKLYGQVNKLPVWIKQHSNIRKLNLQMTIMLSQEDIDALGDLPKLAILFLYFKVFPVGELQFGRQFKQLHLLKIGCSTSLQAVTFCSSGFPSLEALKLHCYSVSSIAFSGLEHLRELKEVWLSGSYGEQLKQHLQTVLSQHPNEIKPVLRQGVNSSS